MAEQLYGLTETDRNKLRALLDAFEGGSLLSNKPAQRSRLPDRNYTRIWYRNDSGETVPAFGCMRVTGTTTVNGFPAITIAKPDTSFRRLYLVNGPVTVADGYYGWGTWLWHADWVLYDDANTPAFGESWGPQNGSWEITKWRYGFTIWGGATGGSTDLVWATQGFVNSFWGQTDATLTKGSTATVSVYDGNDADTSINVSSVKNKFATVASSKKVACYWEGGSWYAIAAECS